MFIGGRTPVHSYSNIYDGLLDRPSDYNGSLVCGLSGRAPVSVWSLLYRLSNSSGTVRGLLCGESRSNYDLLKL